jgi:outer membrane protein, multidrug efflux system
MAATASDATPHIAMPDRYENVSAGVPAPLEQWWRDFGDADLNALEDEAFRSGLDARTAAARLLETRETRRAQTAQTWPGGSITGNASREKSYQLGAPPDQITPTSGVTDTLAGNFNVSWELDLFGRLRTQRRIAAADAAQARFNVEGSLAALAAQVADAYFEVQGLDIQIADQGENVRIDEDLAQVALKKAQAGAGPDDEVDRLHAAADQARAALTDLQADRLAARRRLLILIGRGLASDSDLKIGENPVVLPETPASTPAQLLTRRPDIREAEFRLQSQLGTAHLRHLAVWPTITLLPGLGLSRTAGPGVNFIPPNNFVTAQQVTNQGFWNLAAGVTVPTLDIPKLLYQAKAEDARTRQTAIAYEHTVQTAYGEAQNALSSLDAGRIAESKLVTAEAEARRAYEGARKRYDAGLTDLTATLSAEQSWRGAKSALTSERIANLRRTVVTFKALGGGWSGS